MIQNMNKTLSVKSTAFLMAGALLVVPALAPAATLFSDNFNVDSSASWTVNVAPAANAAQQDAVFAWDYSSFGIPAAPGSSDTLGLRMRANIPGGAASPVTTRPAQVQSGLSVSPTGQNFGTSYKLTFYAWGNFFGATNANAGLADNGNSQGGTFNYMFAVATAGTVPVVVGNTAATSGATIDGIGFATTGDGGITSDYRVYPKSGTFSNPSVPGAAANTGSFYTTLFPSVAAPAIQQTIAQAEYNTGANNPMGGLTQAGAFGFAWHKVEITKDGNLVNWTVDNTSIANVDVSLLGALGGNNIALGTSDVNTTTARYPSLAFLLIDNLVVSEVPEPSVMALGGLGLVAFLARRRRK